METLIKYTKLHNAISSNDDQLREFLIKNNAYDPNNIECYVDTKMLRRVHLLLNISALLGKIQDADNKFDETQIDIVWALGIPYVEYSYVKSILPKDQLSNLSMCYMFAKKAESIIEYSDSIYVSAIFLEVLLDSKDFIKNSNTPEKKYKTYLMRDNNSGYFKIGKSVDCVFRERTLQSQNPSISLVGFTDDNIETMLHNKYATKRIRGEWFSLTDSDISEILDLF